MAPSQSAIDASTDPAHAPAKPAGRTRWVICLLLFAAVVLSYTDRLVLALLKPLLEKEYNWTEEGYANIAIWFQFAYGVGYIVFGRLIDRVGAKIGFAVAMGMWTIGYLAQTLVTSTSAMAIVRLPLGLGEAGTFPASIAATAEWFPQRERALAIGLFNAGSNVGAILTPLVVPAIVLALGWRAGFWITGTLNFVWLAVWLRYYRRPREHPSVTAEEVAYIESDPVIVHDRPVPYRTIFRQRQTWAYMTGRFLLDPVWWLFLFWLPDFFARVHHIDLKNFGPPLIAVYLLADCGSIAGGYASSKMLARGFTPNRARKLAMFGCSLFALPVFFAQEVPSVIAAVLIIGLAAGAYLGFSSNLFAMPSDLFPRSAQGTVIGVGGFAGAVGGMIMSKSAGWVLATLGSYTPIFIYCGVAYMLTLLVYHLINPHYEQVKLVDL